MNSEKESIPHETRTATEPRQLQSHVVTVSKIVHINDDIRTFRLGIQDKDSGIDFSPGQWLDVHFSGLERAGGYTIISTPGEAKPQSDDATGPYLELAVQNATTPQVQRLWGSEQDVLGMKLRVRVGGSFTWPPSSLGLGKIGRVLLLAGGVGINPLISMVSHMHETNNMPAKVDFLYATKVRSTYGVSNVLSLARLLAIRDARPGQFGLHLRCSGYPSRVLMETAVPRESFEPRRILESDVLELLGDLGSRKELVCYVCGPTAMTDYLVDLVNNQDGIRPGSVQYEKWW